jgi:Flp pilus assembly protein CpaB
MKKNLAPILAVAFAMAAVCTAVFYGLVAGKLGSGAQADASPHILVAARDIARGATVGALDVKPTPWTGGPVPEGALMLASQANGLTALTDLATGEPVLSSQLANKRTGGGLGIPAGMRAISVQVHDSSGVVALLRPGLRVDVQAVYSRTGANQDAEIRTVLENIEILKVNPTPEPAPGRPALPVATLLVSPADADTVGLADSVARVRLVLRNPLDPDRVPRNTMGVAGLMRGGGSFGPVPVARNVAPAPVVTSSNRTAVPSALSLAAGPNAAACNPPKAESSAK